MIPLAPQKMAHAERIAGLTALVVPNASHEPKPDCCCAARCGHLVPRNNPAFSASLLHPSSRTACLPKSRCGSSLFRLELRQPCCLRICRCDSWLFAVACQSLRMELPGMRCCLCLCVIGGIWRIDFHWLCRRIRCHFSCQHRLNRWLPFIAPLPRRAK